MSYLEQVLDEVNQGMPPITSGFTTPTRLDPKLVQIVHLIKDDPIMVEATLAWIKQKLDEVTVAKITLLRGQGWVQEKMSSDKT